MNRDVTDAIWHLQLRTETKLANEEDRQIHLVDEGILIEEIMRPHPTGRLRARKLRDALKRFAED